MLILLLYFYISQLDLLLQFHVQQQFLMKLGLSSHVDASMQTIYLAIFSLIFFVLALAFALKPGKILTWIGKILNPLFFSILLQF